MNSKTKRNIFAVLFASLPVIALSIWFHFIDDNAVTMFEMLVYPLAFGTGLVVLIMTLNKYICRADVNSLNPGRQGWIRDNLHGLILYLSFALLAVVEQFTVAQWFPTDGPSPEIQELIRGLTADPFLLIVWLGPVVWIGVALFEELHRVFFLKCLSEVWQSRLGIWFIVLLSASFTGAVHAYQGVSGIVSTGLMGLIASIYYVRYRRLLPLVIAHALYDSSWIILGVFMSRN